MKSRSKYVRLRGARKLIPPRMQTDICSALAGGKSLTKICETEGFPSYEAVSRLYRVDPEFQKDFDLAMQIYLQKAGDEIIDIADDGTQDYNETGRLDKEHIMRSGLRIDARKWVLSKRMPEKYGAKEAAPAATGSVLGDLKSLIELVVSVARGKPEPKVVEAEIIEVKQIADKE